MKRFLAVLLGLAVSLTACAPAASETTSEAPATVETAPAEAAEETLRGAGGEPCDEHIAPGAGGRLLLYGCLG